MDTEKVIKSVHDARRYLEDREWVDKSVGVHIDALNDAIAMLKEQPEIVRCKDCVKHGSVSCPMCKKYVFITADNWFCVDGERKEGQ